MNRYFLALILTVGMTSMVFAIADSLKFVPATKFKLIGKGFADTKYIYSRLPVWLETKTRQPVWDLSINSSGLAIRFRTNSRIIGLKWEVTEDQVMNHFAPSGIKGLDLYGLKEGKWVYAGTARPEKKKSETIIVESMIGEETEYLLYLPLYDGIINLEIGIDKDAIIDLPKVESPVCSKPIVFYGTSITQGGCASRPGMSYPNILMRMLNHEIVNLGFSGNAELDLEIAEALCLIDASVYVIDCLPNVDVSMMNDRYIMFIDILHQNKPEVPIVLMESILFTKMDFDQNMKHDVIEKNNLQFQFYKKMKEGGYKKLYYIKGDRLIGNDFDATVDGIHPTDLGFERMANEIFPMLKMLINKGKKKKIN